LLIRAIFIYAIIRYAAPHDYYVDIIFRMTHTPPLTHYVFARLSIAITPAMMPFSDFHASILLPAAAFLMPRYLRVTSVVICFMLLLLQALA